MSNSHYSLTPFLKECLWKLFLSLQAVPLASPQPLHSLLARLPLLPAPLLSVTQCKQCSRGMLDSLTALQFSGFSLAALCSGIIRNRPQPPPPSLETLNSSPFPLFLLFGLNFFSLLVPHWHPLPSHNLISFLQGFSLNHSCLFMSTFTLPCSHFTVQQWIVSL